MKTIETLKIIEKIAINCNNEKFLKNSQNFQNEIYVSKLKFNAVLKLYETIMKKEKNLKFKGLLKEGFDYYSKEDYASAYQTFIKIINAFEKKNKLYTAIAYSLIAFILKIIDMENSKKFEKVAEDLSVEDNFTPFLDFLNEIK